MATTHISEAEAARDFAALMARVRAGEEVVIESGAEAVAILLPPFERHGRLLSEFTALTAFRAEEVGNTSARGADFATDPEKMPAERKPGRLLSEATASAETQGKTTTLDGGFEHDLMEFVDSHREPLASPKWD